jgi:hypothetical protein
MMLVICIIILTYIINIYFKSFIHHFYISTYYSQYKTFIPLYHTLCYSYQLLVENLNFKMFNQNKSIAATFNLRVPLMFQLSPVFNCISSAKHHVRVRLQKKAL